MSFSGKSGGFATKAEIISTTSGGSGWCSIEGLSENDAFASACPKKSLHRGNSSAIDAILDAQDLMEEVGVTDANAQASILAAVSSKISANPRRNAHETPFEMCNFRRSKYCKDAMPPMVDEIHHRYVVSVEFQIL